MKLKFWLSRILFGSALFYFTWLLVGCAPRQSPYLHIYKHVAASEPPFPSHLEPFTIYWLFSRGVVKYGMTLSEIQAALDKAGSKCGMVFRLRSFDSMVEGTGNAPVDWNEHPPMFHDKPFHGTYYWLTGDDTAAGIGDGSYIAFQDGKAAFMFRAEAWPQCMEIFTYYLPNDVETARLVWELQKTKNSSPGGQASLNAFKKWLPREAKLADYLHHPHSLKEVKAYCSDLLSDANPDSWKLLEQPFEDGDWGTNDESGSVNDYIYCVRGKMHASKMLVLRVAAIGQDADGWSMFTEKKFFGKDQVKEYWSNHFTSDYCHAYFNDRNELTSVTMFIHQMPIMDTTTERLMENSSSTEWFPNQILKYWEVKALPSNLKAQKEKGN